MARLNPTPYPGFEQEPGETFDACLKRTTALLGQLQATSDALPEGAIVGGLLDFPRGDGKAFYLVTSAKPLTLQHVPFGDAYRVDPVTGRTLQVLDVQERLGQRRKMRALFGRKETA